MPEAEFEAEVGEWRDRVSAEGARVTTRLEKAWERELRKNAKTLPEDEAYTGPSEEEIRFHQEQEAADQKAIALILDSNEPLAALKAEYERQSLELATVKAARDGFMNRCNELIRRVKTLRTKLDKMEREHGKSV